MTGESQVSPACRAGRVHEQPERGKHHLTLPDAVTYGTHGAAHEVRSDEHAGHLQPPRDVREGPNEYRDRGDPCPLEGSADESDRPVAHRSRGHQEAGVHVLGLEALRPLRRDLLAEPRLRRCAGEAVVRVRQAHAALCL